MTAKTPSRTTPSLTVDLGKLKQAAAVAAQQGEPELELIDFDEAFKEAGIKKPKWKVKNPAMPIGAARTVVIGDTGTGKTTVALSIILLHQEFDQLWLFCKDPEDEKYEWLMKKMADTPEPTFMVRTSLAQVPELKDINRKKCTIVIFDDMVAEDPRSQRIIEHYFVRGRHRNLQIYYLAQGYSQVPKLVRRNCNYAIIFEMLDQISVDHMARVFARGVDRDAFKAILEWGTAGATDTKRPFLLIDKDAANVPFRYRRYGTIPLPFREASETVVKSEPSQEVGSPPALQTNATKKRKRADPRHSDGDRKRTKRISKEFAENIPRVKYVQARGGGWDANSALAPSSDLAMPPTSSFSDPYPNHMYTASLTSAHDDVYAWDSDVMF